MDNNDKADAAPVGTGRVTQVFRRGFTSAFHVPGLVLFATSIGFGALARDAHLHIGQAIAVVAAFYALPAQVVFVDQIARGAGVAAAGFLVALTAIRFVPMTVSIVPLLRGRRTRWWQITGAVHFMAITTWVEGQRHLRDVDPDDRLAYFVGLGIGVFVFTSSGTAIGFFGAAELGPVLAAALLFMTPIYFLLALLGPTATRVDLTAVVFGAVLGPIMYLAVPGFDLLLTGLIGGSAAYFGLRRRS